MQHDHVLKKLNYDLLTQTPKGRGVCGQNICYHVACALEMFDKRDRGGGGQQSTRSKRNYKIKQMEAFPLKLFLLFDSAS